MQAEITLVGAAAQMSRALLPEISKNLTQRFADCLEAAMSARGTHRGRTAGFGSRRGCHAPACRDRPETRRGDRSRALGDLAGDQGVLPAAFQRTG
jgi:hypothetical protein